MITRRPTLLSAITVLLMSAASFTSAQVSPVTPAQAADFMGTWVLEMTNPAGSQQRVRIWDAGGTLGASVQVGRFPATDATAVVKDGNMLALSPATRLDQG